MALIFFSISSDSVSLSFSLFLVSASLSHLSSQPLPSSTTTPPPPPPPPPKSNVEKKKKICGDVNTVKVAPSLQQPKLSHSHLVFSASFSFILILFHTHTPISFPNPNHLTFPFSLTNGLPFPLKSSSLQHHQQFHFHSFSFSLSTSLPYLPSSAFPFKHPWWRILTVRSKIREIFMPALSSTMTEGKIVSWIKSEGD